MTVEDGTTISYSVFDGADPAVVILHGLAGSGREFIPTAHALAPRRVLLIDQRGHGLSTRMPAEVSRAAFVNDVARVIEAEGAQPVDLIGQSMGAHTALLVAAAHPDLVNRLVLLEGNEGGGSAEEHAALGDYFRSWETPFSSREEARELLGGGPLARAWAADLEEREDGLYPRFAADVMVRAISEVAVPRWSEWESITAPTLVVYAGGGMFTEGQKAEFVARGKNAKRADLAGATHDAHLDAFDQWCAALRGFLIARRGTDLRAVRTRTDSAQNERMPSTFGVVTDAEVSSQDLFEISLDVDAHMSSMQQSDERAIAGTIAGAIGLGETVTWRACHLGIWFTMTSKITALEKPTRFVDEQMRGPFKTFVHEHRFVPVGDGCRMIDTITVGSPIFGRLVERAVLVPYLRRLITKRNSHLLAELT